MIRYLRLANFRSIKDELVVDFSRHLTGHTLKDNLIDCPPKPLLKTMTLYGANASGKSNILRAFLALNYLVRQSASFLPDQEIAPWEPFLFDVETRKAPVRLGIGFHEADTEYAFEVAFLRDKIIFERLRFRPENRWQTLYERKEGKPMRYGEHYRGARRAVERLCLPNQLFLSKAAQNNVEQLLPVYGFFEKGVVAFAMAEFDRISATRLRRKFAERLAEKEEFARKVSALVRAFDTGLVRVDVEEIDWTKAKFPEGIKPEEVDRIKRDNRYLVLGIHQVFEKEKAVEELGLPFEEESAGTRQLLLLACILIDALETGKVVVIDEFEKNLHPHITRELIRLFHDPRFNPHNAQLLIATHEVSLLAEEALFRKDQVWLVEKDERGQTEAWRLSEMKEHRRAAVLDRRYLAGVLGGTPLTDRLAILEALTSPCS